MEGASLLWRIGIAEEESAELLMALLSEVGFDSFEIKVQGIDIDKDRLNPPTGEHSPKLVLEAYGSEATLGHVFQDEWLFPNHDLAMWVEGPITIPKTNWNAEWESNFQEVRLGAYLGLRAPFHPAMDDVAMELVMMPRMSFGTGHHETTLLMSWWLLGAPADCPVQIGHQTIWPKGPLRKESPLVIGENVAVNTGDLEIISQLSQTLICSVTSGKFLHGLRVLDMGCGTGVLGILASRLGASSVVGIDVEPWSAENAAENAARNAVPAKGMHVTWLCGDAALLQALTESEDAFDLILANINRNVLLNDMSKYCDALKDGGQLWLSGFYTEDHEMILMEADKLGLVCIGSAALNNWSTLLFIHSKVFSNPNH